MLQNDSLSRVLFIDLSRRQSRVEDRRGLFERSLGGAGVAVELLAEQCPKGADPLGPANPVVLSAGPLTGLFPLASKTVAMFKSPHTGNLGESHAGGRSAVALRSSGYGAIVITGASPSPVYLAVDEDRVRFRDASSLWGVTSSFTVGRILRDRERAAGFRSIMRIGRAGESLVTFACVTTETYRHFGRLGLGAVFGAKKLKALVISGHRPLPVSDAKAYREVYQQIYDAATTSPVMRKYHDLGTAENILPLHKLKGLPLRNLSGGNSDDVAALSGEKLAEGFLGRRVACSHCPVACIHLAALREPSEHEPYFYKTSMIGYDYEPIYALGTMLGVSKPEGLLKLVDAVEVNGVDAMSTGVLLSWATEAMERGLISEKETGGLCLGWGNFPTYAKAVRMIVDQPNDFWRSCGKGVQHAADRYGGLEFALSFGGNEMPGYHTGPVAHLGYLIGARHSHLDSAGYSVDQKSLSEGEFPTPEAAALCLVREERWRQILSSLVVCFFARGIYKAPVVSEALQSAGYQLDEHALEQLGARILAQKCAFKLREGFSPENVRIPRRILETPTPLGAVTEEFLRTGIGCFWEKALADKSA